MSVVKRDGKPEASLPVSTAKMFAGETMPELSLLGGPLQRLGYRLGLVRHGTDTVWMGIALGLFIWGLLSLLRLLEGSGSEIFSLPTIRVPVRFLVAIPLFFLCETWVFPQMAEFTRFIVRSDLVPEASLPALASDIRRVGRMKDSWLAEVVFLLAAFAVPMMESTSILPGRTASWALTQHASGGGFSWATGWYLGFGLPLFRFLMFRWLWRLSLWWYFLLRIERLNLWLVPTHSDGSAGLGYLETVHATFTPLVLAISAVCSAGFAERYFLGSDDVRFAVLVDPNSPTIECGARHRPASSLPVKLYICRWTGLSEYMAMAFRYANVLTENGSGMNG
jgi:hypothetical protein